MDGMKKYGILLFFYFGALYANSIVTNPIRGDGFGAQYQTLIYSIIYAELTGNTFAYSPFRSMEHNYDNDPDFIKKKEWLVNLIGYFPINQNIHLQEKFPYWNYISFFESHLHEAANSNSLKKIKELFRKNKKREEYFDPEQFHIALHIRRPNPHDCRIDGSDTPDQVYLRIIEELRMTYPPQKSVFHIYSQGNKEDFRRIYSGSDIVFHINETIEDTFSSLVLADVLVTSRSSFSYTAAILSEGIVYYLPFWHPPLSHWKIIRPKG